MARQFSPLFADLAAIPGLSLLARNAYGVLAREAKWHPGQGIPARMLAGELGKSRSHVKRSLAQLEGAGLLDVTRPGNGLCTLYALSTHNPADRALCYPRTCPLAGRRLTGGGQVTCPLGVGVLTPDGQDSSTLRRVEPEREREEPSLSNSAIRFGAEIKRRVGVPLSRKALSWIDFSLRRGAPLGLALEVAERFTWAKHIRELAFEVVAEWERVAATVDLIRRKRAGDSVGTIRPEAVERVRRYAAPEMVVELFGEPQKGG
jgi:DNA-binding transcriptional ArsR family regulator